MGRPGRRGGGGGQNTRNACENTSCVRARRLSLYYKKKLRGKSSAVWLAAFTSGAMQSWSPSWDKLTRCYLRRTSKLRALWRQLHPIWPRQKLAEKRLIGIVFNDCIIHKNVSVMYDWECAYKSITARAADCILASWQSTQDCLCVDRLEQLPVYTRVYTATTWHGLSSIGGH